MRGIPWRRGLVAVSLGVAIAVTGIALPTPSGASGGSSIALAPTVTSGVEYFGDTASDPTGSGAAIPGACFLDVEYSMLHLVAGDEVLVAGKAVLPAWEIHAVVLAAGTTDGNVIAASVISQGWIDSDQPFTAPSTGDYPLLLGPDCSGTDGPFHFIVTIARAAELYVAQHIQTRTSGTLAVDVRAPDGSPISDPGLTVTLIGRWKGSSVAPAIAHVLASAHPLHGVANLHFRLPASLNHKSVVFVVRATGEQYQKVTPVTSLDRVR